MNPIPMKIKHGFRKCEICKTQQIPGSGVFLARLPADTYYCRLWVKAIGEEDLLHIPVAQLHKKKYVCGKHFTAKSFGKKKKRLCKTAVPTLSLLKSPLNEELLLNFPPKIEVCHTHRFIAPFENITKSSSPQVLSASMPENCARSTFSSMEPIPSTSFAQNERSNAPLKKFTKPLSPQVLSASIQENDAPSTFSSTEPTPSTSFAQNERSNEFESNSKNVTVCSYQRRCKNLNHSEKNPHFGRKQKHMEKLLKNDVSLKNLAKSKIDLDDLESGVLKSIVQNALTNQYKSPQGKRWDFYNKMTSLAIYKRSPKAYRYIQQVIPLPSTKTLDRLLENLPIKPGMSDRLLNVLKDKVSKMDSTDKYCALLFDEMVLKKRLIYNESADLIEGYEDLGSMGRFPRIANKALVFLIQGLKRKFKQPIAFYFVNGTITKENLSILIKEIIISLEQIGLTVMTTVCDQGPTNIGALNLLKKNNNIDVKEIFFYIHNKKKFIVFDAPHVLKSIRNNFYNAGEIHFNGKIGKWKHFLEAEEKNRNFLNFKKINHSVVRPTYKTKMRVKYAAQALSNTMAAVIKMLSWKNNNPEYLDTADIVENLDKLFDSINGPASPKDIKKGIRQNVSAKSFHIKTWTKYLQCIDTIKFLKSDSKMQNASWVYK